MLARHMLFALIAAAALATTAPPGAAQQGPVAVAHFIKIRTADVLGFEDAAREHSEWHADQDDPWAWPVYQAMTGQGTEYAFITPGHTWADLDAPPVDAAADLGHWVGTGAPFEMESESIIWVDMPELSNPPPQDMEPLLIVQVFEWEIRPGGDDAIMHGIQKYKAAWDEHGEDDQYFVWSRVVSNEGPPRIFIAVWSESFGSWDQESPGPDEIMVEAYGQHEADQIFAAMEAAWVPVASRIWMFRPDLSYLPEIPGM